MAERKIKVFKFRISNAASFPLNDDERTSWFRKVAAELKSPEDIEKTIDNWVSANDELISWKIIDITPVTVQRHNNARGDTVDLYYTIEYTI